MARKGLERFYGSKQWKDCREYIKAKYNGLCQECLDKGIVEYGVDVHHIDVITKQDYEQGNWDKLLGEDNLVLLCRQKLSRN